VELNLSHKSEVVKITSIRDKDCPSFLP